MSRQSNFTQAAFAIVASLLMSSVAVGSAVGPAAVSSPSVAAQYA